MHEDFDFPRLMKHLSSLQPPRGRFAPTPSGPLHLGSLLTALVGWLSARITGGVWLLRIDDLDAARCPPGATDSILRQIEAHGLHWDETPRRQSEHLAEYALALQQLKDDGYLYRCDCTRAMLAVESRHGPDDRVYSGRCWLRSGADAGVSALRFRIPEQLLTLDDGVQGQLLRHTVNDIGDFVVRRADGLISYQLACVVDERAQAITEVVRGADLLGSSFRQSALQQALHWPGPRYIHLPVLVEPDGRKLSKQNGSAALDNSQAAANLMRCLTLLGQSPPLALGHASVAEVLVWARENWRLAAVPKCAALAATTKP